MKSWELVKEWFADHIEFDYLTNHWAIPFGYWHGPYLFEFYFLCWSMSYIKQPEEIHG